MKGVGRETVLTLASAHALVKLDDGTVVGDPMEKITLDVMEWTLGNGEYRDVPFLFFSALTQVFQAIQSLPRKMTLPMAPN